jgi:hypothetical protein
MSFELVWTYPALVAFYDLPMHSAMMIDRALIRFAETGQGDLEWVAPYHRLRVGTYRARLAIDRAARTITVLYIYRVR